MIDGPKVYVLGHRIHHFAVGVFLVGLGLGLMLDDWADRWSW